MTPGDLKIQQQIARALRDDAAAHGLNDQAMAHQVDAIKFGIERVKREGAKLLAAITGQTDNESAR